MSKVLRAAGGAIALVVLLAIVSGWWGDYRDSSAGEQAAGESTATAEPAEQPADDAGGAAEPKAEDAPAPEKTAPAKTVVVLTDGLNFREEASSGSNVIRGLDEGEELTLLKQTDGWYQVQDADGTKGWISSKSTYSRVK